MAGPQHCKLSLVERPDGYVPPVPCPPLASPGKVEPVLGARLVGRADARDGKPLVVGELRLWLGLGTLPRPPTAAGLVGSSGRS